MQILVRVTKNYGNKTVYPVCEYAKIFASIAGTTTLTDSTIEYIKSLGIIVYVEQQTL